MTGASGSRTILVIGRSGQVARCLARQRLPAGWRVDCRGREDGCDIADRKALAAEVARAAPDLVVNASAYTAVDRAESDKDAAYAVNRDGPAYLAAECAARATPLVHLSTDYVFDGEKDEPYVEDDPIAPLGVYGASKAAGEAAVQQAQGAHVILRTSWVYSPFGANFLKTMLRLGASQPALRVVDDQRGAPTSAEDLARAIVAIAGGMFAGRGRSGVFHIAGSGETTWFGFAREIFRQSGSQGAPVPTLTPIRTADYPTPARRPRNSRLDCSKVAREYGVRLPHWTASLEACLRELAMPQPADA